MSAHAELRKLQAIIDDLADKVLDRDARIEQLEAALRKISDFPYVGRFAVDQVVLIANAALAPEQEK